MVRKRAEHNEGEISTLEEISLHQQDLERIEHLDRWCPNLKILYLQNNLIPKIENVSRLKDLRYLNLALNNITKIENLRGCEFLEKLDLTVNFVDDLLSVESLRDNRNLRELFLTGNPCTDYDGYRDYVIATLPQLAWLDGKEITKSERILAMQKLSDLCQKITMQQQKAHADKGHSNPPSCDSGECDRHLDEPLPYTPESRTKMHQYIAEQRKDKRSKPSSDVKKTPRALEKDGKMLNINEGKYEFHLTEDDDNNQYILEVGCPRFMESSFIDCDVQPTYVRVTIKDKILQLVLQGEVSPDSSTAKRSQTTGKLLVTMPKATGVIRKVKVQQELKDSNQTSRASRSKNSTLGVSNGSMNPSIVESLSLKPTASPEVNPLPNSPPLKVYPQPPPHDVLEASEPDDIDDSDVPPLI